MHHTRCVAGSARALSSALTIDEVRGLAANPTTARQYTTNARHDAAAATAADAAALLTDGQEEPAEARYAATLAAASTSRDPRAVAAAPRKSKRGRKSRKQKDAEAAERARVLGVRRNLAFLYAVEDLLSRRVLKFILLKL
ncbi:hypothetical protein KEM52_001031 [Ascosphaera acerosa]|nr:hypothetical protein KEM52_001031 [Ascosphaera acerosa]